ncbi:VOC family protein [Alkalibacillus haloalkaliphilus]|uniref:VOC family protein n=1 Tax=Alkalibacillus haloalkaliphilus TaxID=94136 RepID=UPI00293676BA|nr:VOC family protein [Alkalibacillus haloalkaliphilus]MDV2581737.1 glyoxalase [Alkalibacillus haloalkaliphilus]
MTFTVKRLDHVQLAAPRDTEDEARHFFGEILGLPELEKPEDLKKRGGVWFELGDHQLHIGVEEPFSPAEKAHPALEVANLEGLMARFDEYNVEYKQDDKLPGANRIYTQDPFGNRLEILEWV